MSKLRINLANCACPKCKAYPLLEYYLVDGEIMCASCRRNADPAMLKRTGHGGGFEFRALLSGLMTTRLGRGAVLAALILSGAWLFALFFNPEINHIPPAIAVSAFLGLGCGWVVGQGVYMATDRTGGRPSQILAIGIFVLLSIFIAIPAGIAVASEVPEGRDLSEYTQAAAGGFSAAMLHPLELPFGHLILLVWAAAACYQAWKVNEFPAVEVEGPYLTDRPPPASVLAFVDDVADSVKVEALEV